jgi:hypothetical protein
MEVVRAAPGDSDEMEADWPCAPPKGDPKPSNAEEPGLPGDAGMADGGGGDDPKREDRRVELRVLGDAAKMVCVVGTEGEAGTARLELEPVPS